MCRYAQQEGQGLERNLIRRAEKLRWAGPASGAPTVAVDGASTVWCGAGRSGCGCGWLALGGSALFLLLLRSWLLRGVAQRRTVVVFVRWMCRGGVVVVFLAPVREPRAALGPGHALLRPRPPQYPFLPMP